MTSYVKQSHEASSRPKLKVVTQFGHAPSSEIMFTLSSAQNLDDSMSMLARMARQTHDAIHARELVPVEHPVWSNRPYKVYLRNDKQIGQAIQYVEENPVKEGLAPQKWSFVSKFEK